MRQCQSVAGQYPSLPTNVPTTIHKNDVTETAILCRGRDLTHIHPKVRNSTITRWKMFNAWSAINNCVSVMGRLCQLLKPYNTQKCPKGGLIEAGMACK